MGDLPDWLQAMRGRREQPPRRPQPIMDPQVTARLRRDFGGDAFGQMGRDFRSGFDTAAANVRQALPDGILGALSNSGVPGWQGLQRAQATARAVGMDAPGEIPLPQGAALGAVIAQPKPLRPPPMLANAPTNAGMREPNVFPANQAQLESRAMAEARARAQAGIQEEGYPYMRSPSWVASRVEMDRALERDRAARAERERREGVSFEQWWRHGGRQDPRQYDPSDPAYRFSRLPENARR